MAEKISTLIIKVDLHCTSCTKKIKKVLTKLQDREKIQSVAYEEKTDTVIVSGPFDPKRLSKKLCCKAGNVIINIQVKPDEPPPPLPPPPPPPPLKQLFFPYPYFCCAYAYPYPYPYLTALPFVSACECHGRCRCKIAADSLPSPVEAVPVPVPVPFPACGAGCYDGCRTCKFVCEDEAPTCSII